jgi:hypothetical protein
MNEKEYGINVNHNVIWNPGFSIANKDMGSAVKLSQQFRENKITMHLLFKVIKCKYKKNICLLDLYESK